MLEAITNFFDIYFYFKILLLLTTGELSTAIKVDVTDDTCIIYGNKSEMQIAFLVREGH